jgi:ornithine cyclodeaminase/alanine dehydrogenase-like protein (mu-crystallin family)
MVLLLSPDDINGLITIKEAVDAMEQGLKDWANNPQVGALRRRVHAPSGARVTVHQGAPDSAGVAGLLTHCEQVVIHPEGYQTYAVRGRPVRVIYNAKSSELLAITIGEVRVNELPDVNNVAVIPTACATAGGVKWLARKNSRRVGILGLRRQAKSQLAACKAILPTLKEARVYSPTAENHIRFAAEKRQNCGENAEANLTRLSTRPERQHGQTLARGHASAPARRTSDGFQKALSRQAKRTRRRRSLIIRTGSL